MKIKCVLPRTDFVPMVKTPRFWISPETVKMGSIIEIEPEIGHQLLANYPGAFQVMDYNEVPKPRKKRMEPEDIQLKVETNQSFAQPVEAFEVAN